MTTDPHDCVRLVHEWPEFRERIGRLHAGDEHFARLVERYHALSRELHGLARQTGTAAARAAVLDHRRLHLKGVLYEMLRGA